MNDFGDQPSLDDISRSDSFIDALAGGRQAAATDDTDAMLAAMLGDWRDELRWPPESELISEDAAFAAIQSGIGRTGSRNPGSRNPGLRAPGSRSPGWGRRHLSVVGAAAAAVLCLGGFGAVVAGSGPGDALYGLRTMLFGAPKQVRDDQVALAAQVELYQVQQMIARGDWEQAQDKLVAVSNKVAAVGDQQQKQELFNQWNQLSARVVERDPEATVPPGITYTVLPSVNELVPTPAPTTLPSMPPITLAVPSEESPSAPVVSATGSPSPNPSVTTELPGATSSVPTDLPSSSVPTSPMQETQQASTSAPAPTSASPSLPTSAATSAPASSAPTSSAASTATPQTSAAQTSTAAPNSAAATTTPPPPSSSVPSSSVAQTSTPASAETTTAAAAQQSTAAPATTAPAATTAQQQTQPTKQSSAAVVTTTAAPGA